MPNYLKKHISFKSTQQTLHTQIYLHQNTAYQMNPHGDTRIQHTIEHTTLINQRTIRHIIISTIYKYVSTQHTKINAQHTVINI